MSRLYFLEFFVTELHLDRQILLDAGESAIAVKINLIDFPTFEMTEKNVSSAIVDRKRIRSQLDFRAGQACHFTSSPENLVKKMLRNPLSIRIFREGDSFPLCLAQLPLSGCLCDQVKSLGNLILPKPYVFGGRIGLADAGGNPGGSVDITLRITCNGKYLLTSYVLDRGCFIFKSDGRGAEFKAERLRKDEEVDEKEARNEFLAELENMAQGFEWEDYTRDVSGIFPSARRLSLGEPPPEKPRVPLPEQQQQLPVEGIEMKKKSGKIRGEKKDRNTNKNIERGGRK